MPEWEDLLAPIQGRGESNLSAILVELVEPDEHIPRLAAIGRAQDPSVVQLVDDSGGPAVADAQAPLKQ